MFPRGRCIFSSHTGRLHISSSLLPYVCFSGISKAALGQPGGRAFQSTVEIQLNQEIQKAKATSPAMNTDRESNSGAVGGTSIREANKKPGRVLCVLAAVLEPRFKGRAEINRCGGGRYRSLDRWPHKTGGSCFLGITNEKDDQES